MTLKRTNTAKLTLAAPTRVRQDQCEGIYCEEQATLALVNGAETDLLCDHCFDLAVVDLVKSNIDVHFEWDSDGKTVRLT